VETYEASKRRVGTVAVMAPPKRGRMDVEELMDDGDDDEQSSIIE
jgi:hypothetical protein